MKAYERELAEWTAEKDKTARGEKPERPVMEHFYTTDSTTEAIAPGVQPGEPTANQVECDHSTDAKFGVQVCNADRR